MACEHPRSCGFFGRALLLVAEPGRDSGLPRGQATARGAQICGRCAQKGPRGRELPAAEGAAAPRMLRARGCAAAEPRAGTGRARRGFAGAGRCGMPAESRSHGTRWGAPGPPPDAPFFSSFVPSASPCSEVLLKLGRHGRAKIRGTEGFRAAIHAGKPGCGSETPSEDIHLPVGLRVPGPALRLSPFSQRSFVKGLQHPRPYLPGFRMPRTESNCEFNPANSRKPSPGTTRLCHLSAPLRTQLPGSRGAGTDKSSLEQEKFRAG